MRRFSGVIRVPLAVNLMEPNDAELPNDEDVPSDLAADPNITRDLFLEWRAPRRGSANPEYMTNPVWRWLVNARCPAYVANARFDGPPSMDAGPGWCFSRFGQSETRLPDGRRIQIAGEHEDHYDPDFYIYNDVVIRHPDGGIDILGYPEAGFPPTDFHSATRVDDRIILIGNLGYPQHRRHGETQVLALSLSTWAIEAPSTTGTPPGWIHDHVAELAADGDSIVIRGGKLDRGGDRSSLVENIDDWRLHLRTGRWERLTDRNWPRWDLVRADGRPNHLWEIQQAAWSRSVGWDLECEEQLRRLGIALGTEPRLDDLNVLFCPPIPHTLGDKSPEEFNVFRIRIDDVVVRYVVDMTHVQVTIEGRLPPAIIEILTADVVQKLSALENTPFTLRPL